MKDDVKQDPRDVSMPDNIAVTIARRSLLKPGLELEVVDNNQNWLRCLLIGAEEHAVR